MVKTIIKREFLDNLISLKFIACVLVAIVLTAISTAVQARNYLDRLSDYNKGTALAQDELTKVPAYSFLGVSIYKKPSPMSIFVTGIEGKTGSYVTMTHREIPTSLKGGVIKNEFSSVFSFFDLSSIIITIFSILAILLSYDSISGEKESGMLSLVLSNSFPRSRFLTGKYLGGMISLALAVLLCFLAGSLILLFSKGIALDSGFFVSAFLIYLFSLLYLSAVFLIGILASSLTKSSFQSLIVILAFYLLAVFLLPLAVNNAADGLAARGARQYDRNVGELLKQRAFEIGRISKAIPIQRSWSFKKSAGEKVLLSRLNPPETIAYYESLLGQTERLKEEYALKIQTLRQEDLRVRQRIDRLRNWVLALFPPSCFGRVAELEAGTGQDDLIRFFQHLTQYWRQYVHYLDEKNAFSLRYFYPFPKGLPPAEEALVDELTRVYAENKQPWFSSSSFQEVKKINERYEENISPLDLSDLPVFTYQKRAFAERLQKWSLSIVVLFFNNLLAFALAYFTFARYDARTEN